MSSGVYIHLGSVVYTSWRMPIYVLADAYIRLGSVVYTRWRMPAPALADACTGYCEMKSIHSLCQDLKLINLKLRCLCSIICYR